MIGIIGGAGFIGSRLSHRFESAAREYLIFDIKPGGPGGRQVIHMDVRDLQQVCKETAGGVDALINLAAEHRDDVSPRSLYDEVNVHGARNVCEAARKNGINRIIFTSSVAVYGFAPSGTDELGSYKPFNDYGRTKMEAEAVYREWLAENTADRSLTIIRPTVVFGERNRGNVYNLLKQISGGTFIMVGRGCNKKSMAYVENVAAFIEFSLTFGPGEHTFNYVDKPDLDMNTLLAEVRRLLGKRDGPIVRIPYWLGRMGGVLFDAAALVTGKKLPISAIRIKKFCSETAFSSFRIDSTGFKPPVSVKEGLERTIRYEFLENHAEALFYTE